MDYKDVVGYWGGQSKAGKILGLDRRRVDAWKTRRIPTVHQIKAWRKSQGKLRLDEQAKRVARDLGFRKAA